MTRIDTSDLKLRLEDYLRASGVEIDTTKHPPLLRCPSPDHADESPSAIYYADSLHIHCPVCSKTWDIFDCAGLLHGLTSFGDQKGDVLDRLGITEADPTPAKTRAKKQKPRHPDPVALTREQARKIYTREELEKRAKKSGWGKFIRAWSYLDAAGLVVMIDARFENEKKKNIISLWTDGKGLRTTGASSPLYGADKIASEPDTPVLVVEGCKTAQAAEQIPGFVVVTWPGGTKRVTRPDWSPLKNRRVYIYPDDDLKRDGNGNTRPWHKQPGYEAAIEIKKILPQAKIIRPLEAARKVKADGADIVEALEVMSPADLAKYILESPEMEPPITRAEAEQQIREKPRDDENLPYSTLGIGDDGRAAFIGRGDRLIQVHPTSMSKSYLLAIAPEPYWQVDFGHKGKITWDQAIDCVLQSAMGRDFDSSSVRGRGAWREKDGRICYHDGQETFGDISPARLYVRRPRQDMGILGAETSAKIAGRMAGITTRLSFETPLDHIRIMGWALLAPFAGALPWRPAALLTGESGSGKSTILDYVITPLARPLHVSGGESTEAGVRQRIGVDACGIVIDEAETDTDKKRRNREALFSLMRMSTSDDAPIVTKGTIDGKGQSFQMRSMFLFSAISPEVDAVADDNRIFRVNLVAPDSSNWKPLFADIQEVFTPENCAGIRARVWNRLGLIIKTAKRFAILIQDLSGRDARYSLADGMLQAAYRIALHDRADFSDKEFCKTTFDLYAKAPPEEKRDESAEMVERLLDERMIVERPDRGTLTIREMCQAVLTGNLEAKRMGDLYDDPAALKSSDIEYLRFFIERIGLSVIRPEGEICIAINHHEIMKILGVGRGYHRMMFRHLGTVDRSRVVWMAGRSRRCVVLEKVLEKREEG
jgi:putative DNA primase/helicase